MLEIYAGTYANLTIAQQTAVNSLTVRRYVEDYYYLGNYLETEMNLLPGNQEFEYEYQCWYKRIENAFSLYDENTRIVVIFLKTCSESIIPLASFRIIHGTNKNAMISQSIGNIHSSIPTHRLLKSFAYTSFPNFNPDAISECEISECTRRVTLKKDEIDHLISLGLMSKAEADHFFVHHFNHLMVASVRYCDENSRGVLLNLRPFHANALRKKGLNVISLYSQGVEPTAFAIDSVKNVLAPLFQRWKSELKKYESALEEKGIPATIKELSKREIAEWQYCNVQLPVIILFDKDFFSTLEQLEHDLQKEHKYFRYTLNPKENTEAYNS